MGLPTETCREQQDVSNEQIMEYRMDHLDPPLLSVSHGNTNTGYTSVGLPGRPSVFFCRP